MDRKKVREAIKFVEDRFSSAHTDAMWIKKLLNEALSSSESEHNKVAKHETVEEWADRMGNAEPLYTVEQVVEMMQNIDLLIMTRHNYVHDNDKLMSKAEVLALLTEKQT